MILACSSRDTLDETVHALRQLPGLTHSVFALHSDLSDTERVAVLQHVAATAQPAHVSSTSWEAVQGARSMGAQHQGEHSQRARGQQHERSQHTAQPPSTSMPSNHSQQQHGYRKHSHEASFIPHPMIIVSTDAALRALPKELMPLPGNVPLVVQYDVAPRRDAYQRRVATVFGSGKDRSAAGGRRVVVSMASADELDVLRSYERLFPAGTVKELPVHALEIFARV